MSMMPDDDDSFESDSDATERNAQELIIRLLAANLRATLGVQARLDVLLMKQLGVALAEEPDFLVWHPSLIMELRKLGLFPTPIRVARAGDVPPAPPFRKP